MTVSLTNIFLYSGEPASMFYKGRLLFIHSVYVRLTFVGVKSITFNKTSNKMALFSFTNIKVIRMANCITDYERIGENNKNLNLSTRPARKYLKQDISGRTHCYLFLYSTL